MRILSMLFFLLFAVKGLCQVLTPAPESVVVVAQCTLRPLFAKNIKIVPIDTPKVIVTENCWRDKKKDPESIPAQKGLTGKVAGLNVQTVNKAAGGARITLRCGRTHFPNEAPLLIVDGVVQELSILQAINPDAIKSVDILKSAAATAVYGPEGVYGAIYVTTKNGNCRTFVIKDFLDGSKIAGATVSFISADKKDTLMYVAGDSGTVITDKLKPAIKYKMNVSAVGYKSVCIDYINKQTGLSAEILLSRKEKVCDEVVVTALGHSIRCYRSYCLAAVWIKGDSINKKIKQSEFKIFPNPVQKGEVITIEIENSKEDRLTVKILALDGRLMLTKSVQGVKGSGRFQLAADTRWSAGVYIVQVTCANGKILASDKIIIQ